MSVFENKNFQPKDKCTLQRSKLFSLCFFGCIIMNPATSNNNNKLEFFKILSKSIKKKKQTNIDENILISSSNVVRKVYYLYSCLSSIPFFTQFLLESSFLPYNVSEIESNLETKSQKEKKKHTRNFLFLLCPHSFDVRRKITIQNIHKYIILYININMYG